jgi:hypothetical protein
MIGDLAWGGYPAAMRTPYLLHSRSDHRGFWAVASLLLMAAVTGCGGGSSSVSGEVKFNGQPIPEGTIRLDPLGESDAPPASAPIQNGKYEIPSSSGLQPGKYRVAIMAVAKTGRTVKAFEQLEGESGTVEQLYQYIPEAYNRESTLEVELNAGDNPGKNFELTPQS